jgi:hypothetical protein
MFGTVILTIGFGGFGTLQLVVGSLDPLLATSMF